MRSKLVHIMIASFLAGCLLAAVPAIAAGPAPAGQSPQVASGSDGWKFGFALYGYFPAIGGEVSNGKDFDVDFDDIFDNLNFAFMGMAGAYKGKWSFVVDGLYMDVEGDDAATVSLPLTSNISISENVKADMEIETWVVTPTVGYELLQRDKFNLTLLAGLRYLWIDTSIEVKSSNRFRYSEHKVSDSQNNWDGIVGARGQVNLNDKWYLPYYADVGTGDSDLTWQVYGGVGYRFNHFDLVAAYRYMSWDFDDGDYIIDDMYISGPMVGAVFMF